MHRDLARTAAPLLPAAAARALAEHCAQLTKLYAQHAAEPSGAVAGATASGTTALGGAARGAVPAPPEYAIVAGVPASGAEVGGLERSDGAPLRCDVAGVGGSLSLW